jgi:hypothetical protein
MENISEVNMINLTIFSLEKPILLIMLNLNIMLSNKIIELNSH